MKNIIRKKPWSSWRSGRPLYEPTAGRPSRRRRPSGPGWPTWGPARRCASVCLNNQIKNCMFRDNHFNDFFINNMIQFFQISAYYCSCNYFIKNGIDFKSGNTDTLHLRQVLDLVVTNTGHILFLLSWSASFFPKMPIE
jgi:hypothetical protein